jgi:flagellar L-ring protein precursor FlgH
MRRGLAHALLALALLVAAPSAHAASLWAAETLADGNLYSDQVARKPGDLITIMVKETTSVTDSQKTERSRTNDINAAITMLPQNTALPAAVGATTMGRLPAIAANSEKEFEGEGKYTAEGEVRAVITGRVTDVLENGNLVIEGRRIVRVNEDSKTIVVTGVIRTADVRSDNTVLSEKLHNFQVGIEGEGPLSRSQQEGWLGRLFDVVWPF